MEMASTGKSFGPLTLPNIKDGFSLVEKLEIFENLLQNH
jgi:hypothetical protein